MAEAEMKDTQAPLLKGDWAKKMGQIGGIGGGLGSVALIFMLYTDIKEEHSAFREDFNAKHESIVKNVKETMSPLIDDVKTIRDQFSIFDKTLALQEREFTRIDKLEAKVRELEQTLRQHEMQGGHFESMLRIRAIENRLNGKVETSLGE